MRASWSKGAIRIWPNAKYPGTASGQIGQTQSGGFAGSGSAEAQLTAMAKRIAAERRCTFAQAYVEALNGNPELYVAYLREHERSLLAGRRS